MLKYASLMLLPFLQGCFHFGGPQLLWQAPIASDIPPVVQDGLVYVEGFRAGHPGAPRQVFALDARTGQEKWVSEDSVYNLYGASGGYVFLRNMANHLVQLDARTGKKIHESDDSTPPILNWAIRGDTMFIVNASLEVVAVDNRLNKVLWRMTLPFQPGDDTDLQLAGPNVIVSGNYRHTGAQYGALWALDAATGKEIWHFEAPPPHDYAPLKVLAHDPYVLATRTAPTLLHTHVLDARTGQERYPPIAAFDLYGCYEHIAYAPGGAFDLRTGQRTAGEAKWLVGSILYKGMAWQRKIGTVGAGEAFLLRTTYDGDFRGSRNWTDTPPNSSLEGIDIRSGQATYHTKTCKYTRFSTPMEAGGLLFHTSIAMMKEGKSGVWAYWLP